MHAISSSPNDVVTSPDPPNSPGIVPATEVKAYLAALKARWWIVAYSTGLAAVAAFAMSASSPKKYDGAAKLMIENGQPADVVLDRTVARSTDPERDINTSVALVKLETIARRVNERLNLNLPPFQLLQRVSVATQGNSNVLVIKARDRVPERAAAIANTFAREYVAFRESSARAAYHEAAEVANTQFESLSPKDQQSPEGRNLDQQATELRIAATLQTGGVQLVDAAKVPTTAATPNPKMNALIGAFLGFLVGSILAIMSQFADRRLKDEDDIESLVDLPVLAKIPHSKRNVVAGDFDASGEEAYATLAVNLRLLALGADLRTIMFVSGNDGDWKTSVTLGVGKALASMGQRVIAIEADFRQPKFAEYLGLVTDQGIARIVERQGSLAEELVQLDPLTGRSSVPESVLNQGDGWFAVLPAGRALPDPHRLLSSQQMNNILSDARRHADVILIDTPALGSVSDALSLGGIVDTSVFVVRLKHSTKEGTRRTLQALTRVGMDIAGIVITGVAASQSSFRYLPDEQVGNRQSRRSGLSIRRRGGDRQGNEEPHHGGDAERTEAREI